MPILSALAEYSREAVPGANGTIEIREQQVLLWGEDRRRKCVVIPNGLLDGFLAGLDREGIRHTMEVVPVIEGKGLRPSRRFLRQTEGERREWLQRLVGERQALLHVATPASVTDVIADMCRLFPRAHIVIPVATRKQQQEMEYELSERLEERVDRTYGWRWPYKWRIVVTTFEALKFASQSSVHMIIVPRPLEAVGDMAGVQLSKFANQRIYGLLTGADELHLNDNVRLPMLFGTTVVNISHGASARRPVEVVVVPYSEAADRVAGKGLTQLTPIERKRLRLWHNSRRNRRIAEIARALQRKDRAALLKLGMPVKVVEELGRKSAPIAVLAENREHAGQLRELIQDAQMESGPQGAKETIEDSNLTIITAVAAHARGISAQIVIAASGGEALVEIRDFPGPAPDSTPVQPQIIVEIDDGSDGGSKMMKVRLDRYRGAKWKIHLPENDTEETRLSGGHKQKRKQERK